ncbi:hypothetical protein B0H19DRAFT_407169 [Mycena capillaripes]|nr:hypothetical protein B0H19DRAFT_407169 [Mycena capillaripes]
MWQLASLGAFLETAKKVARARKSSTASQEQEEESEEEAPEASVIDQPPLTTIPPVCRVFLRAVDAVCAWTTAVPYLLASPVAKESTTVKISIVDLPRREIPEASALSLLARWTDKASWSTALHSEVHADLIGGGHPTDTSKGAVHCEAGLAASLYLHLGTKINRNQLHEPSVLSDAFASLDDKISSSSSASSSSSSSSASSAPNPYTFPIGVAKKCCPVCKMLIQTIQGTSDVKLEFAGAHARFYPWVPPDWLPVSILEALEVSLLQTITDMVRDGEHLLGSRATSPSGISVKSETGVVEGFETTAVASMVSIL